MSNTVTGKLIEVFDALKMSEKFTKQEIVILSKEQFKQNNEDREIISYIKIQFTNKKCELLKNFKVGDVVEVGYNLRGNKSEKDGKTSYWTNIEGWSIMKSKSDNNQVNYSNPDTFAPSSTTQGKTSEQATGTSDDLPF